jgi:hypothetical protein
VTSRARAAIVISLIALGTLIVRHDWLEMVLSIDPDGGDGSAEWLTLAGLTMVFVFGGARRRHDSARGVLRDRLAVRDRAC